MSWTELQDVRDRFHRTIPASREKFVGTLIDDAEDELKLQIPDLERRVDTEQVPKARVVRIVCKAVTAVLRNPDGYVSEASARGPFSNSGTRAAGTVRTEIQFPESDLRALRSPQAKAPAGTIRLHLPAYRRP